MFKFYLYRVFEVAGDKPASIDNLTPRSVVLECMLSEIQRIAKEVGRRLDQSSDFASSPASSSPVMAASAGGSTNACLSPSASVVSNNESTAAVAVDSMNQNGVTDPLGLLSLSRRRPRTEFTQSEKDAMIEGNALYGNSPKQIKAHFNEVLANITDIQVTVCRVYLNSL